MLVKYSTYYNNITLSNVRTAHNSIDKNLVGQLSATWMHKLDVRMSQNRNKWKLALSLKSNRPKYILRNKIVDYLWVYLQVLFQNKFRNIPLETISRGSIRAATSPQQYRQIHNCIVYLYLLATTLLLTR